MASSLISSLISLLDRQELAGMASRLGESEESVSRGLGSTFAALLSGMASKTNEPGMMRQIFDLIGGAPKDTLSAANLSSLVSGGGTSSPIMDMGRRLLSTVFGGNQSEISDSIGRASGLSGTTASRLMSLAAPMLLGFLGKRVREEGMSFSGFTNFLQRESADLKSYIPTGLSSLWSTATAGASKVGAYTPPVEEAATRSSRWLIPALAALALFLGVLWFLQRGRDDAQRVADRATVAATEGANRARLAVAGLGDFVRRQLPGNISLNIPENGVEARLASFLQDASTTVSREIWFDFDRLHFNTGSAAIRPESEEQLQNIASIMKAFPNVRLKIGGYTDNTGTTAANMKLSQDRADAVKRELAGMGVAENRLEAEGYGDQHPMADNATEEGRAKNRRISMRVLEK